MKPIFYLVVSIIFLVTFGILVFNGGSNTFSLPQKNNSQKLAKVKKSYWRELSKIEKEIQFIIDSKRNQKIFEVILKNNRLISQKLKLGKAYLKNLVILSSRGKPLYFQDRKTKSYFTKNLDYYLSQPRQKLFITSKGLISYVSDFKYKFQSGMLIFQFDISDLLKRSLGGGNFNNASKFYFYRQTLIHYDPDKVVDKNFFLKELRSRINACNKLDRNICNYYLLKSKQNLVSYLLSERPLEVRLGFLYPDTISSIPTISIFVLLGAFLLVVFLFFNAFKQIKMGKHMRSIQSIVVARRKKQKKPEINREITSLFEDINQQTNNSSVTELNVNLASQKKEEVSARVNKVLEEVQDSKTESEEVDVNKKPLEKNFTSLSKPSLEKVFSRLPNGSKLGEESLDNHLKDNKTNLNIEKKALEKDLLEKYKDFSKKVIEAINLEESSQGGFEGLAWNWLEEKFPIDVKDLVKNFIIFSKSKFRTRYIVTETGFAFSQAKGFAIEESDPIFKQYLQNHQGVIVMNERGDSEYLKKYFTNEELQEIKSGYFLPIVDKDKEVKNILLITS